MLTIAERHIKRDAIQFAALPWRIGATGTREVMLLTSRETRRWVIPKGWPMRGRKPAEVACQEAWEEAGLIGRVIGRDPFGRYHYERQLAQGAVLCEVLVFLFQVECQLEDWPEKGQRETRWFKVTEAATLVNEGALAEIIERFSAPYPQTLAFRHASP